MHKLIIAPPGAGKTLYTRELAKTPPFSLHESDGDRNYIYRVAGLWDRKHLTLPPFRAPHHTVSEAGIVGVIRNRYRWQPGEASLAHGGTLFLDELPEFRRGVLEALREPLQRGTITYNMGFTVPARFRLVCAMNPCPCGYAGSERRECRCTPEQIKHYAARVPQWLRDACEVVSTEELIKSVGEIV